MRNSELRHLVLIASFFFFNKYIGTEALVDCRRNGSENCGCMKACQSVFAAPGRVKKAKKAKVMSHKPATSKICPEAASTPEANALKEDRFYTNVTQNARRVFGSA